MPVEEGDSLSHSGGCIATAATPDVAQAKGIIQALKIDAFLPVFKGLSRFYQRVAKGEILGQICFQGIPLLQTETQGGLQVARPGATTEVVGQTYSGFQTALIYALLAVDVIKVLFVTQEALFFKGLVAALKAKGQQGVKTAVVEPQLQAFVGVGRIGVVAC